MAAINSYSFDIDTTATALGAVFDSVTAGGTLSWVTGRWGGKALSSGASQTVLTTPTFTGTDEIYVHWAMKADTPATVDFLKFQQGGANQITLRVQPNGTGYELVVRKGITTVYTSPVYSANTWRSHEFRLKVHTSAGEYDLHTNGIEVTSATGINTQSTGTAEVDQLVFTIEGGTDHQIDDIYIWDDTGSYENTFPKGDTIVEGKLVTGNGTYQDFTVNGAASNYMAIDDATEPDEDTTYIRAINDGDVDTYSFQAITSSGTTVHAVIQKDRVRLSVPGSRTYRSKSYDGSNMANGTSQALDSDTWKTFIHAFERAPDGTAWTTSKVDANEFGFEAVS